ncbi:MAG: CRISPR-associated helicase Cas3', partial [Gemmatimonadaceae bacterium]
MYSLTVPTGGGKTLTSLRFALKHAQTHGMARIVYCIPFTSIIEQNAADVRAILETAGSFGTVVLEHHSNLEPEHDTWRSRLLSETWDAPIVFTTNVQFLESLFGAGTRGVRRMHQLANVVIVFDEIQTLPVSCVHLFNNAVNFLVEQCGATALLCTATQPLLGNVPAEQGALKISETNELLTEVDAYFVKLRRVQVMDQRRPGGWTNEQIVALAVSEIGEAQSCLVVVNTKESARALRSAWGEREDVSAYHLSTHMCPAHRAEVLSKVRRDLDTAGRRVVCFSTQLIEAGVNIDFGSVIRFVAGLDSIGQAAGRCNRHKRRETGRVHVVNSADENLTNLRDIRIGRDVSDRILDDFRSAPDRFDGDLIGPAAMKEYYRHYFYARESEMSFNVPAAEIGHDDTVLRMLSRNDMAVQQFKERYDA